MKLFPFCPVLLAATALVGTARAQTTFTVRRVPDDSVAFSGDLSAEMVDPSTSVPVRLADFTSLAEPGDYYVEASGFGRSVGFRIGEDVYDSQIVTLMLGYYGWRSGIDIAFDYHGTHYGHRAGHLNDALLDYVGQPGVRQDGTGGWYDAGDYGKYIPTAAQSVGTMLAAWELFSDKLGALSLPFIPEHGGPLPDYLAELKWELDWMLKMAFADGSGRVCHKLSSLSYPAFIAPADDTSGRYFDSYSSTATADFAATMAQAARVYSPYDAAYADQLLGAAELSYAYLVAHPDYVASLQFTAYGPKPGAGNYVSTDEDDRLWAAAEIWETTGDPAALRDFETRVGGASPDAGQGGQGGQPAAPALRLATTADWDKLQNLGIFTYLLSKRSGRDDAVVARLETQLSDIVSALRSHHDESGYGRALLGFIWGSNGILARTCMFLHTANALAPDPTYLDVCAAQIGSLYGRNQYNRSQVTGEGIDPPLYPHHRPSASDAVDAPYPGLLVGGGDSATNWVDLQASARTNEVAINYNSALVYALAGFLQGSASDESTGAVAAQDCGVRVSSIGYLPNRSKVATLTTQCELPSAFKCVTPPDTFQGDTLGPASVIDDLEDGDTNILNSDGRQGSWFTFDDGSAGTRTGIEIRPAQREGSQNAACISGRGYTSWGGGLGFQLSQAAGASKQLHDASGYTGVTFWARGSSTQFRLMLVDQYSDARGGICGNSCNDHFQKSFTPGSEWQKFTFTWQDFTQQGFGTPWPSTCPAAMYALQFQWPARTDFELCLDDVLFTTPAVPDAGQGGQGGQGAQAGVPATLHLTPAGGGCSCTLSVPARRKAGLVLLLTMVAAGCVRRRRAKQPADSSPTPSRRRSVHPAEPAPALPGHPNDALPDR